MGVNRVSLVCPKPIDTDSVEFLESFLLNSY